MRGIAIGMTIGAVGVLLWAIEFVRREGERDRATARPWPRPDTNIRSFGAVWDFPEDRQPDVQVAGHR